MSFGSRLREIRIEKNISQKSVAMDIGISSNTISQYESNSRFPNEDLLKRLCTYYNISSDYLLGLTDTKHTPFSKEEAKDKMMLSKQLDMVYEIIDVINKQKSEDYKL